MTVKTNKDLNKRNTLNPVPDGGFLQSGHWEKFQKALDRNTARIENEAASALLIEHKLPLVGSYFFAPRGPIIKVQSTKFKVQSFFQKLFDEAKKDDIGWIRVEPQSFGELELIKNALGSNFKIVKSRKNHQPAQTLMLDLAQSEKEILAGMKQKTRYNIRLAEKRGVEVELSRDKKNIERFCRLVEITAKRDGVTAHPGRYYEKMLGEISNDALKLYLAKYGGTVIAANLVSFYGGVATYLHGASANENRNLMAPHILQWQAIKDAKNQGCDKYDFGGVSLGESGNSWGGITRFKTGFCPDEKIIDFPGCYDIILNRRIYYLYRILQRLKG